MASLGGGPGAVKRLRMMKISKVGLFSNDSPRAIDLASEAVQFLRERVDEIRVEGHLLGGITKIDADLGSVCMPLDGEVERLDVARSSGGMEPYSVQLPPWIERTYPSSALTWAGWAF